MDYYLDDENVTLRLTDEWEKYGSIVIAYDFDNTVYDYHSQGQTYDDVIKLLRDCKDKRAYLIVFTANEDYPMVKNYLIDNNIPFDSINENPPFFKSNARKIYYNILLDDRAGLSSAFNCLTETLNRIGRKQK